MHDDVCRSCKDSFTCYKAECFKKSSLCRECALGLKFIRRALGILVAIGAAAFLVYYFFFRSGGGH
jgi:hypothetical protein